MITADQLKDVMDRADALHHYLNIDQKKVEFEEEQLRTQAPDFWEDPKYAQEQMKKKGFRRPEIVVWNDGERTNLADAAEQGNAPMFRVEIGGLDGFPEELRAAVQAVAGESEISRAGRHFIVGPLADKAVADKVAEAVMQQNASLEVKIAEIVE